MDSNTEIFINDIFPTFWLIIDDNNITPNTSHVYVYGRKQFVLG